MAKPEKQPGIGNCVIVFNDKGEFLMGKRKSKHATGTYCVPGGWIEFGETIEESAAREVMEETGLQVVDMEVVGITNNVFPEEKTHTITIAMASRLKDFNDQPKLMEPDKCEGWHWIKDWNNMPEPTFTSYNKQIPLEKINMYRKKYNIPTTS